MIVLVLNAGSSSLKYQLMDMQSEKPIAKGLCERIGMDGRLVLKVPGRDDLATNLTLDNHKDAIDAALKALCDEEKGVIADTGEIAVVGHRIPHGGERFTEAVRITEDIMAHIESCARLVPLHGHAMVAGIRAAQALLPNAVQAGVFDTSFHHTMAPEAYLYAIPYHYYEEHKIRRYGFHGSSHRYVCEEAAHYLGKPLKDTKFVSCHLGNGSSAAAVAGGKSVDTSLGYTPLEGLPMGTRSGDIDPAVIGEIADLEGKSAQQVVDILNRQSGLLGLSGVSSDLRDILAAMGNGDQKATQAFDVLAYRVKKYVGSYIAALNGVDALIFTAGLGENSPALRAKICENLEFLGISIDPERNEKAIGAKADISAPNARVKTLVIPTNEELVIARDAASFA